MILFFQTPLQSSLYEVLKTHYCIELRLDFWAEFEFHQVICWVAFVKVSPYFVVVPEGWVWVLGFVLDVVKLGRLVGCLEHHMVWDVENFKRLTRGRVDKEVKYPKLFRTIFLIGWTGCVHTKLLILPLLDPAEIGYEHVTVRFQLSRASANRTKRL